MVDKKEERALDALIALVLREEEVTDEEIQEYMNKDITLSPEEEKILDGIWGKIKKSIDQERIAISKRSKIAHEICKGCNEARSGTAYFCIGPDKCKVRKVADCIIAIFEEEKE